MKDNKKYTVRETIYLSYSNLAMAHMAIEKQQTTYTKINYMVRSKLYNGLMSGKMNIRSLFDDEKIKIETGKICNYCGSIEYLALDHILPQKLGGKDDSDNLIFACRNCNSSKGKKDLMEWMAEKKIVLPLMIIRRYLKLTHKYCFDNNFLDKDVSELDDIDLPFKIKSIPISFPLSDNVVLVSTAK